MLRSKDLHTKTCKKCNKVFRTDNSEIDICSACEKQKAYQKAYRDSHKKEAKAYREQRRAEKFHRTLPDSIPLREYTAIIKNYNDSHKTNYSYGQFELLRFLGKITEEDLKECAT